MEMQVDQNHLTQIILDTSAAEAVEQTPLVQLVVQVHRIKVLVVKDMMPLTYLMSVIMELDLLGLDGHQLTLDHLDLVLVDLQLHTTEPLSEQVEKAVEVLLLGLIAVTVIIQDIRLKLMDTLVETSGVAVVAAEKEMDLAVVMEVMELLLLHMMPHQQLSVPLEVVKPNF
tara:strand:+ start:364 stop:876 length:513 start_codon:yes stop_codon:yes gene_type:complete